MEIASLFATLGLKPDKESWAQGDRLISGVKKALGAIAAFKAVSWAKGAIREAADLGGKLNDLSQTVGINVELLQELGYAAQQNGSSLDGMAVGVRFLARNMQQAKKHGGEAADAFRKAGIKFKTAGGALRPVEDVLGDLADKLAKMPDGAEKTALAMNVLGRSGASLIPALNGGRKGLEDARKRARELGLVLSGDAVKRLDNFGDKWDDLRAKIKVAIASGVAQVAPALERAIDAVLAWTTANRELLATIGAAAWKAFSVAADVVAIALRGIAAAIQFVSEHASVMRGLMIAIAIAAAVAFGPMILAWLKAKLVIAAIIVAITAIWVVLEPVLAFLWRVARFIGEKLAGAFLAVGRAMARWLRAVVNTFGRIKKWVVDTAAAIKNGFLGAIEFVKQKFIELGTWLGNLPIIKQLGMFGKYVGGRAYDYGHMEETQAKGGPEKERNWIEAFVGGASGLSTVDAAMRYMSEATRKAPMARAGAGAQVTNTFNTTITTPPGADSAAFGREIDRRLDGKVREALADVGGKP